MAPSRVLKKLVLGGKTANKPESKRVRTRIKSRRKRVFQQPARLVVGCPMRSSETDEQVIGDLSSMSRSSAVRRITLLSLNFSFQGQRLGSEVPILQRAPIALGKGMRSRRCRARARCRSSIRFSFGLTAHHESCVRNSEGSEVPLAGSSCRGEIHDRQPAAAFATLCSGGPLFHERLFGRRGHRRNRSAFPESPRRRCRRR